MRRGGGIKFPLARSLCQIRFDHVSFGKHFDERLDLIRSPNKICTFIRTEGDWHSTALHKTRRQESVERLWQTSIWMALTVRHVNGQHQRLWEDLAIFTSKGPKKSIPVKAKGALPNPSFSEGKSDIIGADIIEADIIGARFAQKTHFKRIRWSSLRRPRTQNKCCTIERRCSTPSLAFEICTSLRNSFTTTCLLDRMTGCFCSNEREDVFRKRPRARIKSFGVRERALHFLTKRIPILVKKTFQQSVLSQNKSHYAVSVSTYSL